MPELAEPGADAGVEAVAQGGGGSIEHRQGVDRNKAGRSSTERTCLCWQSHVQMPVLKQFDRLAGSVRPSPSSSRSASGILAGVGLSVRLQQPQQHERHSQDALMHPPGRHGMGTSGCA